MTLFRFTKGVQIITMKKLVGGILLSAMMLSTAVYAADITATRDIDNSTFEFNCTAEAGDCITVDVYAPNNDINSLLDLLTNDSLNIDAQKEIVKYHNEFYADDEGKLQFKVGIDGNSGVYKAYVTIGETVKELPLEYVKKAENDLLLSQLNDKNTDVLSLISSETNRANLGFFLDLYDNVDASKVAKLIKEKLPASTPDDAVNAFNEAVIITALSEGDISGISEYADKLAVLDDGGRFEKRYSIQAGGVDTRLKGKVYNTVAEFESALAEAVVLETIKNPNGYGNIRDVMDEFKTEIGIAVLTDSAVVYQNMVGKDYKNFAEMKAAYSALVSGSTGSGGGNSGSGSGSNSGSGSSSGSGVSTVMVTGNKPSALEKSYFNDMENAAWAKEAVNYLAEEGIISGKSEGNFHPADEILREEFVKMIVNAFGFEPIADFNEFSDVSETEWYYEYVVAAKQNGIVNGVSDTVFGIGERITRQDMAAILYRVSASKNIELKRIKESKTFNDDDQISDYAKEAINALQASGIINGMDDGSFMPGSTATRAQAARMIYGLLTVK